MSVHIYIPRDSVAVALGADEIAETIAIAARDAGRDIEIVRTGSRGMAWLEPLVEVECEGARIGYGPVCEDDVAGLVAAGLFEGGKHALCIGPVEAHPYIAGQQRQMFKRCGITDPLDLASYENAGGLSSLKKALTLSGDELVEEVMVSGLRGRGGAAFPAGIKWRTVAAAEADQKYIVCNADEGDSGTFADRMIMEGDPYLLIEGMVIAGIATGATEGVIYLRSEYPVAKEILGSALESANVAGLLGSNILGSGKSFDLKLFIGAGAYICGEETSLLESLEGKAGQVRAKPPIPALVGLHGKPTLVHNVLSLCAIPDIIAGGGNSYAARGVGRSSGTMPFQLGGNIKHGGLIEVPFGISLRELIETYGGGSLSGRAIRAVQVGGPLGAYLPTSQFDTPMTYEALMDIGAGLGHGGIVVFDDTVDMSAQARYAFAFCAAESCGKCTPCRIGSVRGVELMDQIIAKGSLQDDKKLMDELLEVMEDGSLCAMGGMTPIPVRSAFTHFPADFAKNCENSGEPS